MKTLIITLFAFLLGFALLAQQPTVKVKNPCDTAIAKALDSVKVLHDSLRAAKQRETKHKVSQGILGTLTVADYILGYLFAFLGILFTWLLLANQGRKNNPNTPTIWSWKEFFNWDNIITRLRTFLIAVMTIYIVFRFAPEITKTIFSYFFAFGVGLSIDYFTDLIAGLRKKLPVKTDSPTQ